MLRVFKVTGDSLYPAFRQGDFVLISKIPFLLRFLKPGDVIVFDHPVYGTLIKRIDHITPDGESFFVVGSHEWSVDSRQFGTVSKGALLGKVILHIRKPAP